MDRSLSIALHMAPLETEGVNRAVHKARVLYEGRALTLIA